MPNIICSIQGGGLRGIIPCCVLMGLETYTGKPTRESIQFCAGTSTGALLTAGVAAGIPASTMLEVYMGPQAEKIFSPSFSVTQDALMAARGWVFDPANLYRVLVETFGAKAAMSINDSPIPILINATEIDGHDWYFVKDGPRNSRVTGHNLLVSAATASACAPPYFKWWAFEVAGKMRHFYDGGTGGLANPIYQAAVEAFHYDSLDPSTACIVSLGTGYFPDQNPRPPRGLLETIEWATDSLVDTSEDWMTAATRALYPEVDIAILNPQLPFNISYVDLSARETLLEVGQKLAATIGPDGWKALLEVRRVPLS